jgi:hypothetical protein
LKPGIDYTKLDERGVIRVGEMVDETTVLVGMYLQTQTGDMMDASKTAQVWTRGRVEKISVTVNNLGHVMVKVRVVQERIPELGDKFSNRHGQKGTIGMFVRGYDMPRTKEGIPVDMIMNPHAIPSRMTVAQLIEALVGKAAPSIGSVGNGTLFMNDGSPVEAIGKVLRDELGMEPFGDELMYDGMGGKLIPTKMFVGNVYTMRLKHMPEDKWNARGEGRREQRTHQPTGGRGAQGGLRIGEMERDAILGHGIADFLRESLMKRADGYSTIVCNGCGTIPIYNEKENLYICPTCDGPVGYIGDSANTFEILPPTKRSVVSFSKIEIPYAFKLLDQEMNTYLNMGMRVLTSKDVTHFRPYSVAELTDEQQSALLEGKLPERILPETQIPAFLPAPEEPEVRPEDLAALGAVEEKEDVPVKAEAVSVAASAPSVEEDGVLMKIGNMNLRVANPSAPVPAPVPVSTRSSASSPIFLDDDDTDDIPFAVPEASTQLQAPSQAASQAVSVQTTNQPVLVVPLSMNQAPAPTEIIPPAAPGAPSTIAVDTSETAMKSIGAQPSIARPTNRRSTSPSTGTNQVVSVNKMGATPAAQGAPSANVRVSVNKLG